MFFSKANKLALFTCCTLIGVGCQAVTSDSIYLSGTNFAAKNHIMLVRNEPPSFGFFRLAALERQYPNLSEFLKTPEYPDLLAETVKGQNRYLILYYLKSRKAFACRTGAFPSRQIEFSGPYPITDGELKTLRSVGNQAPAGI
jgi:hypothetical protein